MSNARTSLLATAIAVWLSGCAVLPDTTLGHKCGIPTGVECRSMQEVYDRVVVGDLPGLNPVDGAMPRDGGDSDVHIGDENPLRVLRTRALYAPPEELRIWINRWRDTDGDLHDDAFVYVLVGEGQWLVRD